MKSMGERRLERENWWDPLEVGVGWGKGRLQQVFCYRAGDETGGSDLEQQKER